MRNHDLQEKSQPAGSACLLTDAGRAALAASSSQEKRLF